MFTGIVEELGEVVRVEAGSDSARITIRGPLVTSDAFPGASIAVNGVCLTVVELGPDGGPAAAPAEAVTGAAAPGGLATFTADVMAETLSRTGLATIGPGARVNLERPVAAGGRLGGHVVQGHVDGVGAVVERVPGERWELVRILVPAHLSAYVVEKGSIAVDGVSLTVVSVQDAAGDAAQDAAGDGVAADGRGAVVTVSLIPETLQRTTLGRRAVGESVNLEVDVLAKYVERLVRR